MTPRDSAPRSSHLGRQGYHFVWSILLFLVFILGIPSAFALAPSAEAIVLNNACRALSTPNCTLSQNQQLVLTMASSTCQAKVDTNKCVEHFEKYDEPLSHLRKCKSEELCRERQQSPWLSLSGCFDGAKGMIEDTVKMIADMAESIVATARKNVAFRRACDESLECKRQLVLGIGYFDQLEQAGRLDTELQTTPIDILLHKRQAFIDNAHLRAARAPRPLPKEDEDNMALTEQKRIADARAAALQAAAVEWLKKQGILLDCYDTRSAAELVCYGVSSIVDPTMAVGIGLKTLKGIKAYRAARATQKAESVVAVAKQNPATLSAGAGDLPLVNRRMSSSAERVSDINYPTSDEAGIEVLTRSHVDVTARSPARRDFIETNLRQNVSDKDRNTSWITAAQSNEKGLFVELDMSKLKELNDAFHDKDLVTSLNNFFQNQFHQKLQGKIKDLLKTRPDLKDSLGQFLTYNDYKDLRYARGNVKIPDELQPLLQETLDESLADFLKVLKEKHLIRETELNPVDWFEVGFGETADQASQAARAARSHHGPPQVTNFNTPEVRQMYAENLSTTQNLNRNLQTSLRGTGIMEQTGDGMQLSTQAWEKLRSSKTTQEVITSFEKRFSVTLSEDTAQQLLAYKRSIDAYSPNPHIADRVVVSLKDATHGGVSADFRGLGARNMASTEAALLSTDNVDSALVRARQKESEVTTKFKDSQGRFKEALSDFAAECSGDDCVGIAKRALTTVDKQNIMNRLARTKNPGEFRIAFIGDNVPEAMRSELAVHGELIEKILRERLEGLIPLRQLENISFGVDMQGRAIGEGAVGLVWSAGPEARLNPRQAELIIEKFSEAVDSFTTRVNQELSRSQRNFKPLHYKPHSVPAPPSPLPAIPNGARTAPFDQRSYARALPVQGLDSIRLKIVKESQRIGPEAQQRPSSDKAEHRFLRGRLLNYWISVASCSATRGLSLAPVSN